MKNSLFLGLIASLCATALPASAKSYWLVIGSYAQAAGTSKPWIQPQSSPGLLAIPMETLEKCQTAGTQIISKVHKPVQYFDAQWVCVEGK
jgi:hypothetical protein